MALTVSGRDSGVSMIPEGLSWSVSNFSIVKVELATAEFVWKVHTRVSGLSELVSDFESFHIGR